MAFQDGSLVTWDLTIEETESENQDVMYGPMPCKPITIIHKIKDLKVFHGGLPRASYGDKYSVTVFRSLLSNIQFCHCFESTHFEVKNLEK